MREEIDRLLTGNGRAAGREQLLSAISRSVLDNEIRRGRLQAVFPRTYARPWDEDDPDVRRRAALISVGGQVALSHITAVERYGLLVASDRPVHVTAYLPRHPRNVPGRLVVHRTRRPLAARWLDGFPVVRPELALVSTWPLLSGPEQRAPVIEAARRRLLDARELTTLLDTSFWVPGIAALRELSAQLLDGCESELELWGYSEVFAVAGLDHATRQRTIRVNGRTYRLDLAFEAEQVAVELDGRRFHESRGQWERDIARDLDLATAGWLTVRLSHTQLTTDVEGSRRKVLAVLAARRPR